MNFSATGAEQLYTIPKTGTYVITAAGAQGGKGNTFSGDYGSEGGKGAKVVGKFDLTAGDVLHIIVGGAGTGSTGTAKDGTSGGSGGGTFLFREIPAVTDSRWQFTKGGKNFEVLLVAAGGGGAWDESYKGSRGDGYPGKGAAPRTPGNYVAWGTQTNAGTASTSITAAMGISQYISYGLVGAFYTRNGSRGQGGFGGGSATDDNRAYGGGWYGSGYYTYSWSLDTAATGEDGANSGDGWAAVENKVQLPNLVPDPSFEQSGWTGSFDTTHKRRGSRSLKLTGTTATSEVVSTTTASIPLDPSHVYYARVYGWQDTRTNATVGFYWPIAEPAFREGIAIGTAGQWVQYSGRAVRTSFTAGNYQIRLDFNNSSIAGTMYFDCCMMLDLTAAFGAGKEPDKDWCDRMLPYGPECVTVFKDAAQAPAFNGALSGGTYRKGAAIPALNGTATVADGGTITYQWYKGDGAAIAGATNATYTPPATAAGSTQYHVVATNRKAMEDGLVPSTALYPSPTLYPVEAGTVLLGENKSNTVTIQVVEVQTPVFKAALADQTVDLGTAAAAFDGTATANGTVSYQWAQSTDGSTFTTISGATAAKYTPPATAVGKRWYRVTATNTVSGLTAAATSGTAAVTVRGAVQPVFKAGLVSATYDQGASATALDGTATVAYGALTYQWQQSTDGAATFTAISGATSAKYTPPTAAGGVRHYRVVATCTVGTSTASSTSGAAVITVQVATAPTFQAALVSATYDLGATAAALNGRATVPRGTLSYRWQKSTDGTNFTDVPGAASATYTPPTTAGGVMRYKVIAICTVGTSTASTTSNTASITVRAASAPSFKAPLTDGAYDQGDKAAALDGTATVVVGSIAYQWQKSTDGVSFTDISGAVSAIYVPTTTSGGTTYYRVTAVNAVGSSHVSAVSNVAAITVWVAQAPAFGAPLTDGVYDIGTTPAALNGTATVAHGTVSYQWQRSTDGTTFTGIAGATGSAYAPPLTSGGVTWYRVRATNKVGTSTASADSNAAKVTVHVAQAPVFSHDLVGASYIAGAAATALNGTAAAARGTVGYRWYVSRDGAAFSQVAGAAKATYVPPTATGGSWRYYVVAVNTVGTSTAQATSNTVEVVIRVADAPVFKAKLAGAVYDQGAAAKALDGTATVKEGTISYQWYLSRNGAAAAPVAGATTAKLTPDTSAGGSLRYYVEAVNTLGISTARTVSDTAEVVVHMASAPTFSAALAGAEYDVGDTAAAMDGTATAAYGTVGYQWYRSTDGGNTWSKLSGATGARYIPPTTAGGSVSYYVRATNTVGTSSASADSNKVVVTIFTATQPIFHGALPDGEYDCGDTPTQLDGTATADRGSMSYQWQKGSDGSSFANIEGATAATIRPSTATAGTSYYRVVATNKVGTSSAAKTSNVAAVLVHGASQPSFTAALVGAEYDVGTEAAALIGSATVGYGALTYQWFSSTDNKDFTAIPGATAAAFRPDITAGGKRYYRVEATNTVGTSSAVATSNTATITVHTAAEPAFTVQPMGAEYDIGATAAALTVTATAARGTLSYQWYKSTDGTEYIAIPGATGDSYTPPTSAGGRISYYVRATNTVGTSTAYANSIKVSVTVYVAKKPVFSAALVSAVYVAGTAAAALDGTATAARGTITYQWRQSGDGKVYTDIPGATGATYVPLTTAGGTKYYQVTAVNMVGTSSQSATSGAATVRTRWADRPVFVDGLAGAEYFCGAEAAALDGTATIQDGALSYQWYASEGGGDFRAIPGATSARYVPQTTTGGTVRYYVKASNILGISSAVAESNVAEITVNVASPPVFLHTLADAVYDSGAAATTLDGTARVDRGQLEYQWAVSTDGAVFSGLAGERHATYTPPTHPGGTRWYRVTATNIVGASSEQSVSSAAAITVWVAQAPTFRAPLVGAIYDAGDAAAILEGTATAPHGVVTYQWYVNDVAVVGGTAAAYTPVTTTGGVFRCRVVATNTVGDTSAQAVNGPVEITVLVASAPAFSKEPLGAAYIEFDDALALTCHADAPHGPVTYQWFQSGDGAVYRAIAGEVTESYMPLTDTVGSMYYRVEATNTVGITSEVSVSAAALVTVTAAQVPTFQAPLISAAYDLGHAAAKLDGTATVTDGGTITYQWECDDGGGYKPLVGGTEARYRPLTMDEGAKKYRVTATNTLHRSKRSRVSNVATVTVTDRRLTDRQRWELYLETLKTNFTKLCRLEFLAPDGSVAFALDNRSRRGQAFIQDGNLEVNLQNGMRRQCTVTLANWEGEYDFDVGQLWFGQQVRLMEGLVLPNGEDYYLPQGVFYLSDPEQAVEPGKRTITYHLVDKWAYLDGTLFGNLDGIYEVPLNSNIFTAVATLLRLDRGNGLPVDGVTPLFTDYFNSKTVTLPNGTTVPVINTPYTYRCDGESGTYANVILEMTTMLAGLVGYDQTGRLRLEPSQEDISDSDKPVLWSFSPTEREWLGATYTIKSTEVYNDVIVEGESLDDYAQARGRATNMDPRSDTNIYGPLGRRTLRMSAASFYADQQCKDLAVWNLKRYTVLKKSVTITSTQMFHLVENQLVTIRRPDKEEAPVERHLVTGFSRPLAQTGTMSIHATSIEDFPEATITPLPGA